MLGASELPLRQGQRVFCSDCLATGREICYHSGITIQQTRLQGGLNVHRCNSMRAMERSQPMRYNFDEIVDRSGNHAAKYDERKKKFGTDDVIPLWIADMDFRTAQPIIDALTARAQEGIWGYTARPESYFAAIRDWQKRRNGWEIDPSLMSFSLGVVQSISVMVKLFTPEGGNVLIQTPVYSQFYDMAEAWNRNVLENRFIEENGVWRVDWEDFEEKLQSADLFLLCNPHNPLGIVWTPEELRRMAELCMKHHVVLFSDEIHSDLIFHGKKHTPVATLSPEIAKYVVTGISGTKTFNLAGLQASTVVFPNRHTKKVFDHYWHCMDIHRNNAFSLTAMEAAFTQGEEWLEQLLPYLSANFEFRGGLLPHPGFPRSAPTPPTPPISCGWTAGIWGWITRPFTTS